MTGTYRVVQWATGTIGPAVAAGRHRAPDARRGRAFVLTSIQRRIDRLDIFENADLSQRPSPELLFDIMGFGREPTAIDPARFKFGVHSFGPSLRLVADAVGLPLDSVEATGAFATARRPVEIAAGPLAAGTVAAQRMQVGAASRS